MQRSISMPVKPRYMEDQSNLERCEEREQLYNVSEDEFSISPEIPLQNPGWLDDFPSRGIKSALNFHTHHLQEKRNTTAVRDYQYCPCKHETIEEAEETSFSDKQQEEKSSLKRSQATAIYDPKRVITKGGKQNVKFFGIPQRSYRFCKDFVTTLVEQKWHYTLTVFTGSYFGSWFIFTMLWYLIAYAHGDLFFDDITGDRLGEGKAPCIVGAKTFTEIFIYSVETQTTIGFGELYPSEECPEGVFIFILQIIVSIALEGAMISIIYVKMAKPVKHIAKTNFSKIAVICQRDGKLCFCFRVCDPREQQIIKTQLHVYILLDKMTAEREKLNRIHKELEIDGNLNPIILWPETICHVIDEGSPLYEYSSRNFIKKDFEILVSLTGTSPTTGQTVEARTSYLPCEILWGQKFLNVIYYDWDKDKYVIDYDNFNATTPCYMSRNAIVSCFENNRY